MTKNIRYGMAAVALALSLTAGAIQAGCVFSFTSIPTFANMCLASVQSGIYTIRNTTRFPIGINSITIKRNDALPDAAAVIVTAPSNPCGSSLAGLSSCNVQVNLLPLTVGPLNRVLQIRVNSRQTLVEAPILAATQNCFPPAPPVPPGPPVPLFPPPPGPFAFACTILGGSTVTNTGPSAINGSVCVSPGTSITGFPPGLITNGTTESNTLIAQQSQSAATTTYNNLVGLPCTTTLTGQDLGTLAPLLPGVYCFASSAQLTGTLTLDGQGNPNSIFVFQIGSTLTTATGAQVNLINSAAKKNVFWQVGSSATFGTATQFQGNVIALASITFNTGAQLLGTAIARTGAVTLASNIVNPV